MTLPGSDQTAAAAPLSAGARLRAFVTMGRQAYNGGDARMARLVGAAVLTVTAVVTIGVLLVAEPTERIGDVGWVPAGMAVALWLALAWRIGAPDSVVGFDQLYAVSCVGVTLLALVQWLAGANAAPYQELFLLWAVYTGVAHSPRRVFAYLTLVAALSLAVLLLDGWNGVAVADFAVRFLIWTALTMFGNVWMLNVRAHRLELLGEEAQAQQLARVDALTGLGNRRAFDEALEREVARAERVGHPLSVVVADLDGFKAINDRFGHLNGDQCLKAAAGAIREIVRTPDACFRWGGDEFAVLLPDTDQSGARLAARRMRLAVAEYCAAPDGTPLTLACGTAELRDDMTSEDLLAAADLALMSLKSARGRSESTA